MNYSGGVDTDDDEDSAETDENEDSEDSVEPTAEQTPPAPPLKEVPLPPAAPSEPQGQGPLEDTGAQDNPTPLKPPAPPPPNTGAVEDMVKDQDLSTTTDADAPAHTRIAMVIDEDLSAAAGGQTMLLSTATTGEDSALSLAQADALAVQQAGPEDARLGIPGTVVSVATTFVGMLLSPFLAPGPAAPAEPPLLWAVLAWMRREVQRTFFNQTPDAVVDTVTTAEDTPTVIDALGNDTDVEDDPITITSFTQPAHGAVVQNPDGTLTYTPAANYNGPDSFTYTVRDQGLHIVKDFVRLLTQSGPRTDTATVTITVTAVNDAPVAVDDTNTTTEDTPATGNVLTNDTDIDTPASGLSAALGTQAASGTAVVNADGTYTYTPDANVNGTDSFTYTISDGTLTDTGTVTITVAAVNQAPITAPNAYRTRENTALTVPAPGFLDNDTDPDGDTLTALSIASDPEKSTVVLTDDQGGFTYTPNPGFTGTDTLTYTITDGTDTSTGTIFIEVMPNQAPITAPDSYRTQENTALTVPAPGDEGCSQRAGRRGGVNS